MKLNVSIIKVGFNTKHDLHIYFSYRVCNCTRELDQGTTAIGKNVPRFLCRDKNLSRIRNVFPEWKRKLIIKQGRKLN